MNNIRLNDAERIILSTAARSEQGRISASDVDQSPSFKAAFTRLNAKGLLTGNDQMHPDDAPDFTITEKGYATIGIERNRDTAPPPDAGSEMPAETPVPKIARVIALMGRPEGAALGELTEETGWLPHTTRAALTGLRRKGMRVDRMRNEEGISIYRIVSEMAG
jgi:hypothetical protein